MKSQHVLHVELKVMPLKFCFFLLKHGRWGSLVYMYKLRVTSHEEWTHKHSLPFTYWTILHVLSSDDFNVFGYRQCQTVWTSIEISSHLIWVQTVFKCHQQTRVQAELIYKSVSYIYKL